MRNRNMQIPLNLNDDKIVLDAEADDSLLTVLRREKYFKVKCGCDKGFCGNCTVLLNDKPVSSCKIPISLVRNENVETLEYFKKNNAFYADIQSGFKEAGMNLCGYCEAGKIFTTYWIIKTYPHPELKNIQNAIKHLDCCCTDRTTFINGILYAAAFNHSRMERR